MEVGVELRGEATYGQTLGRREGMGGGVRPARGAPLDVAVAVDEPRFMQCFLPAVARALDAPPAATEPLLATQGRRATP
jgi:hypothetical protein